MGLIKKQAGIEVDFDKKAREFCDRFQIMKNCTHICAQGRLFVHKYGATTFEVLLRHYYKGDLFKCDAFKWITLDFSLYEKIGVCVLLGGDFDTMGITPNGFTNTLNELDERILNLNKVDLYIRGTYSKCDVLKYTRIGNGDWRLEQWDSSENK